MTQHAPHVIPSVGERSKRGSQDLKERKHFGNLWRIFLRRFFRVWSRCFRVKLVVCYALLNERHGAAVGRQTCGRQAGGLAAARSDSRRPYRELQSTATQQILSDLNHETCEISECTDGPDGRTTMGTQQRSFLSMTTSRTAHFSAFIFLYSFRPKQFVCFTMGSASNVQDVHRINHVHVFMYSCHYWYIL
jgi:hypothetical protein